MNEILWMLSVLIFAVWMALIFSGLLEIRDALRDIARKLEKP